MEYSGSKLSRPGCQDPPWGAMEGWVGSSWGWGGPCLSLAENTSVYT